MKKIHIQQIEDLQLQNEKVREKKIHLTILNRITVHGTSNKGGQSVVASVICLKQKHPSTNGGGKLIRSNLEVVSSIPMLGSTFH